MVLNPPPAGAPSLPPIRVMVVDDSAVIRGFFSRYIETATDLKVVASAGNGETALSLLERMQVDVVLLDIEMPIMDGQAALPLILKKDPAISVIMASSLTHENAILAMRCLQMGATECIAKPSSAEMQASNSFQESLVIKIRAAGMAARRKRGDKTVYEITPASIPRATGTESAAPRSLTTRPLSPGWRMPDIIAISSSTGGPQALMQLFGDLKTPLRQPILLTQHMPATFTPILAENIQRLTGLACQEAKDGDMIKGGVIYLAPGNYHMTVTGRAGAVKIALNQEPPENFCRPSADPMLRSIVDVYAGRVLSVVLTGMGTDGQKGCQAVVDAGGVVLAQDEATSVVWGMPGAVAVAGLCTQVLPLEKIAPVIRDLSEGRMSRL